MEGPSRAHSKCSIKVATLMMMLLKATASCLVLEDEPASGKRHQGPLHPPQTHLRQASRPGEAPESHGKSAGGSHLIMEEQLAWMLIFRTKAPTEKGEKTLPLSSPPADMGELVIVCDQPLLPSEIKAGFSLFWLLSPLQSTPRNWMSVSLASLRDRLDS